MLRAIRFSWERVGLWAVLTGLLISMTGSAGASEMFSDTSFQYQQPIADMRSMRTGMRTFWNEHGQHIFALQLGDTWGLMQTQGWSLEGRAGVLARFDINTPSFYLENIDLMGALAAEWALGPGALECVLYHLSAHLGGDVVQNDLLQQVNVSRENAALFYSWRMGKALRFYTGPDVIVRADPNWMQGRVNLRMGAEWKKNDWIAAVDLCLRGDYVKDGLDITCMTGYDLSPPEARVRQVLNVFVYRGHKRAGQIEAETETALGVGILLWK